MTDSKAKLLHKRLIDIDDSIFYAYRELEGLSSEDRKVVYKKSGRTYKEIMTLLASINLDMENFLKWRTSYVTFKSKLGS